MRQSESIEKLAAALLAFQVECPPPVKNAENPFFKSKYADLSSLLEHCKSAMQNNGLVFTSVGLTSRLMHVSGQWIEGDFPCVVTGLDAQKVGAAMTYGRRYCFQALLGINAEEDDDANGVTQAQQQVKKQAPKREQAAKAVEGSAGPAYDTGSGDMKKTTAMVTFIKEYPGTSKTTGKPYTKYSIKTAGKDGERWYTTFSQTLADVAKEVANTEEQTLEYSISTYNGKEQYQLEGIVR